MTMPPQRPLIAGFLLAFLLCHALAPRANASAHTVPLIIGDTLDEQGKPKDIASRGTRLPRLMLRRVDAVLLYQPSQDDGIIDRINAALVRVRQRAPN